VRRKETIRFPPVLFACLSSCDKVSCPVRPSQRHLRITTKQYHLISKTYIRYSIEIKTSYRISSSSSDCRGDIRLFISHKRYDHPLSAQASHLTLNLAPSIHFPPRTFESRILLRLSIFEPDSASSHSDIKLDRPAPPPISNITSRWIPYKRIPQLRCKQRPLSLQAHCPSQVVLVI